MIGRKISIMLIVLLTAALVFWIITEAFHLLTEASNTSVAAGVLLIIAAILIVMWLSIFILKKLF